MSSKITEYNLDMYDTPGVRRLFIKGETIKPVGVTARDGGLFLQVEVIGEDSDAEHDLRIEIHGTGWPIPNAEDVEYVGTGIENPFVWHVFYKAFVRDYGPTSQYDAGNEVNFDNADISDDEDASDAMRIYTIYKYPINATGSTELCFKLRFIKVLHTGLLYGQRMAWVLHELVEEESAHMIEDNSDE